MKIDIIIPALDEEEAIGPVLGEIDRGLVREVFVVDNGSTDRTANVAAQGGATVVREPERGYGAACLRGIAALTEGGREPPEIVAFLDADHSDYPEELAQVVAPILAGEADLVIGSRVLGGAPRGALTGLQRFGNGLSTWLMRLIWQRRFTDLGPFRAIRWDALQRLGMRDRNFGWTVEMQIRACKVGLHTAEVPVRYRERIGVSKISGTWWGSFRAGTKILLTIFGHALRR